MGNASGREEDVAAVDVDGADVDPSSYDSDGRRGTWKHPSIARSAPLGIPLVGAAREREEGGERENRAGMENGRRLVTARVYSGAGKAEAGRGGRQQSRCD